MRRYITVMLVLTLLAGLLALPVHAAGEPLYYQLESDAEEVCAGDSITVTVRVKGEGEGPSYLRFYLLYDRTRFAPDLQSVTRHGPAQAGMYQLRDATGEADKYPAGLDAAAREAYGVLVLQWCSLPEAGGLPRMAAGEAEPVISLTFTALAGMIYPDPGGQILLSGDYAPADSPWLERGAVDVSQAQLHILAAPPEAHMEVRPGEHVILGESYVYGFDPAMTQQGSVNYWQDSLLERYFDVTDGSLQLDHSGKAANRQLAGTGSQLVLRNLNDTREERFTLLIFGDLDGNFLVDLDDYALAKTLPAGPVGDDLQRLAADVTAPFGELNAADVTAMFEAAAGRSVISQSGEQLHEQ